MVNSKEITKEKEEILKDLELNKNPIEREVLKNSFIYLNQELIPKISFWKCAILLIFLRNMTACLKLGGLLKIFIVGSSATALFYSYFYDLKERTIYKERNYLLDKEFDKKTNNLH